MANELLNALNIAYVDMEFDRFTDEAKKWLSENNINHYVGYNKRCIKHVMVPRIDGFGRRHENEYEEVSYKIIFDTKADAMRFKLLWG